jgi:RimJ/RimL family protein N-acetyltransferase
MENETDRLVLRRFQVSDAERLFEIYSDPETMRFMGRGPATVDDERAALERHKRIYYDVYGYGLWGIVLKSENRLLGRCGIIRQEIDGETTEEMSYLIDREYWGQGYATEAGQAVVQLAREKYRLQKLIALILPENISSIRVAQKCWFELERVIAEHKIWKNVGVYARRL